MRKTAGKVHQRRLLLAPPGGKIEERWSYVTGSTKYLKGNAGTGDGVKWRYVTGGTRYLEGDAVAGGGEEDHWRSAPLWCTGVNHCWCHLEERWRYVT